MKRLASIQILRALAALGVALFHAGQWSHLDLATGAAGVDVFFVISGFVLWHAVQVREPSPAGFLLSRFGRVAPLYGLATLAVAAIAACWPNVLPIVHPEPRHLVLSLLFLPHLGPGDDPFPLLAPGWTLTYEAFFYLAFAIALFAPRDRRLQVLSGALVTASIIGFAYHGWYTLLCNPLLLEFLAGVGLARAWGRGSFRRLPPSAGWGLIAGGLGILAACQFGGLRDDFLRPFVWGPPAVMVVAGALKLEADGRVGTGSMTKALGRLGDASYSLYLVQAPLIAALAFATPRLSPWLRAPLGLALALVAGLLVWRFVERPLGLALRRLKLALAQRRLGRGFGSAEQETLAAVDADLA